jgi:DNA-binding transcriptional regulator YdaS (Cro superfamily)
MELGNWLKKERGRQMRLAKHLGIRQPVVAAWVSGRRPIPVPQAAAIEAFTLGAVTRQAMFPDAWERIWPELAAPEARPDQAPGASPEQQPGAN